MRSSQVVMMVEYEFRSPLWDDSIRFHEVETTDAIETARNAPRRARAFRFYPVTRTSWTSRRGHQRIKYCPAGKPGKWHYIDGQIYTEDLARQHPDIDNRWLDYMKKYACKLLVTNDNLAIPFDPERDEVVSSL